MAGITVTVGDTEYPVDLDDEAGLIGFIAAVQYLSLTQQGIATTPEDQLALIDPDQGVTVTLDTTPAPVADDGADALVILADLVERGVLTEDEFVAKKAELTGS